MSKTIWFFNDYAGSKYHGMEFRNYYVARELVKLGHKVTIVSASYMHLFKKLPKTEGEYTFENIDGINYIWVKVPHYTVSTDKKRVWKWFVFVKKLYRLPLTKMDEPDYIVASPMAPFLIKPAHHFSKKFNAKLIYEVKDIWPLSLMELGGYSKRHPLIFLMQKFANYAYRNADTTLSVLANAHAYMKDFGLKKEQFKYIPNGISLDEMKNLKVLNQDTKTLLPKNKFIVGYTGTISIANAMEYFIDSANLLKEYTQIHFVMVGEGTNKEALVNKVQKLSLNNVTFIDAIPKDEIQSMLEEFDVCFIGWHHKKVYEYGISANKIFDYMYSQKPILHAFSGKGNLVEMANCGLSVEAQNEQAIAKGILSLYNMSKEQREVFGNNGKEYVLKHHTYQNIAKEFIKTLEEL
ncbi:MAG: Glycosyl transferase, group 1 [uncultured Sulfurovum sp.]|uniref:Glycosyl transferase, group 1 n=1 Tax=uncultured Sulfurovum sp. TaxID=269237 RepID=A0A6S6T0J4_9BACT|nr:MAG: Glycosyl transferase, group 1 [uncultured Sulfurovum sp.]